MNDQLQRIKEQHERNMQNLREGKIINGGIHPMDLEYLLGEIELYEECRADATVLHKENQRYKQAIQKAVAHFRQDEHPEGMRKLEQAMKGESE